MPRGPKLRCNAPANPFHVVLVAPEIPPNTGAVARTCTATRSPVHLIRPLGFDISERAVRRAGVDYWHLLDLQVHEDFPAFEAAFPGRAMHLFSSAASRSYLDADLQPGDALVFGRESDGLPASLLQAHPERIWGIPTCGDVRSLNLSNAVSIVLFEGLRRAGVLAQTRVEPAEA